MAYRKESTLILAILLSLCALLMNVRARNILAGILPSAIASLLSKLYECLDLYRSRIPTLVFSLVLALVFQLVRVFMVYLLCRSLSIDVPITYLLVVVPVALFVQMLPISIYGVGVRESAMVALLALASVPTEMALSLSFLLLAVQVAGAFPGGILFALGSRLESPPSATPPVVR